MKSFFRAVQDSVYSPSFYQELPNKKTSYSVGYFAKLALIVGVLTAAPMLPGVFSYISGPTLDSLVASYPADLEVDIVDGHVSTNQPEPYVIKDTEANSEKENLLVIDTKSPFSAEQFEQYSTFILVKKDFVVGQGTRKYSIIPFKDLGDWHINKGQVSEWANNMRPFVIPAAVLVSLLIMAVVFFFLFANLIYFFLAALLVWVVGRLFSHKLSYMQSYVLAIHASTLAVIVGLVFGWFHIHMFSFSFTVLLLLVLFLNLKKKVA